ncbi:hypothetical protein LTR78_003785 [Recurvomyces mirabilis]|uniref:Uncharacterized protein n=1 Tax=Recurvomyces mirabilis TaxID=574656 RepID=A0AAE0WR64_9PEZI|nr:hypothetical protein LTR78_003785 [Recurvomyces mirabilis]KAK5154897.1 hypothetical protein LTS14_006478 [Recurvomyces mirabilis]
MAEIKPVPPPRSSTTASQPGGSQGTSVRYRMPARPPTIPEDSQSIDPPSLPRRPSSKQSLSPTRGQPPQLLRRRSSILSDVTSFSEDIINPSASRRREGDHEEAEVTHWHSTPLAFAILPALGGLLFKNGSAFVTDVLLLGLAAIFLNWSLRLPWDWYHAAQEQRRRADPNIAYNDDLDEDDIAVQMASSAEYSPKQTAADGQTNESGVQNTERKAKAAADLRAQERLAFLATFAFPVLSAYLLHVIRGQLSRPSSGLISDYNLSIFLLAAEFRPARQLIRLISARTMHLQRTVSGNEEGFGSEQSPGSELSVLRARLAELEAKLLDHSLIPATVAVAQKEDVAELSTEMRKRYEPRLEGLERAVRRYEKRSTTLTMITEQRLNSLETRLQDALSLAAVAAQSSQRRGIFSYLLETASAIIALPMKIAWSICICPFLVLEQGWEKLSVLLSGPAPVRKDGSVKRSRHGLKEGGAGSLDEKQRVKGGLRKPVR